MTIHGRQQDRPNRALHKTMPQAVYHRLDVCIFVRRRRGVRGENQRTRDGG